MAGWISTGQQKRDHEGLRNICAADGHPGTADDPLVKTTDGWRFGRCRGPREGVAPSVRDVRFFAQNDSPLDPPLEHIHA